MVLPFNVSSKKKDLGLKCCAYACNNKPIAKKRGLCHKHYARLIRFRDPIYARFNQWKSSAIKRGKEFFVTLDQFRNFCKRTGYLSKGQRGQNATIDRRCNAHGYYIWNIQLLTNKQNASKGAGFSGDNFERCDPEDLPF